MGNAKRLLCLLALMCMAAVALPAQTDSVQTSTAEPTAHRPLVVRDATTLALIANAVVLDLASGKAMRTDSTGRVSLDFIAPVGGAINNMGHIAIRKKGYESIDSFVPLTDTRALFVNLKQAKKTPPPAALKRMSAAS